MSKLVINGGRKLSGEIAVGGAKNSVLPLLAATLLVKGKSVLHNCPDLTDVATSLKLLEALGCKCNFNDGTVTVDASAADKCTVPYELMRKMRSSIVFMGALAARFGMAELSSPGGCEIGSRPIDIHLEALRKMGLNISEHNGILRCKSQNPRLCGTDITLPFPSVGATENVILASAVCNGVTVLRNAAREPEISDLAEFLNSCGAKISGYGTDTVTIHGVDALHPSEHEVMPDRIVAATYISCAAVTGSELFIKNARRNDMDAVISAFEKTGCTFRDNRNGITVTPPKRLSRIGKLGTLVYPGFPTDACPLLIAAMCYADGTSVFIENIFENRYKFTYELKRLGADIKTEGRMAVVEGKNRLYGACVCAADLRGGAALVAAALAAEGRTEIDKVCYIDRGYEKIENVLTSVGADIKRIN